MEKLKFIEVSFIRDSGTMFKRLLPVDAIACLDSIENNNSQFRVILKDDYLNLANSASPNKFNEAYIEIAGVEIIN